MLRRVTAACSFAALICTFSSAAAPDPHSVQLLYNYSMRCFVAGAVLESQLKRHGAGQPEIDAVDQGTRSAYNAAFKAGANLGYSKKRVSADMDAFQRSEQRRLILESSYMDETRSDCAKLDFLPPASN